MKEWTFDAAVENLPALTELVDAELEALDCPMKAQMQINLAVDELFSNVAFYAYAPGTGRVTVRLEAEPAPRAVELSFIDSGKPYNPLEAAAPDTTLSAEERGIGGLGIFLVRKTMDEMRYAYENGHNVLTIRKSF